MESRDVQMFREAVQLFARTQALVSEREGMIAENNQRQQKGEALAYSNDDFYAISRNIEQVINDHCFY